MATENGHATLWALVRRQHGVVTRMQLLTFGITEAGIRYRISRGRLRRIYHGVYAVGQLPLTQEGEWMAAVLACGDNAALSHDSGMALWRLAKPTDPIHVSLLSRSRSRPGIEVHRRRELNATTHRGIRVTTPAQTLIDVARTWELSTLEQAIGEAVLKRLLTLKALRAAATDAGNPGAALRAVIDRVTFRVTQSELEREFLRLVDRAGLPLPETQQRFSKTRVDFYWPDLQLVVETDGGQFHASAIQQLADRRRDQQHIRAGRTPLRITHWQVFREPRETTALLVDVFTACQCRHGSESSMRAA
jgi:very-short-patch-repair endonuclease